MPKKIEIHCSYDRMVKVEDLKPNPILEGKTKKQIAKIIEAEILELLRSYTDVEILYGKGEVYAGG
jgi:hypothetical protein